MEGTSLDIIVRRPASAPQRQNFHDATPMEVTGDDIAETVQSQFDRLPQKRKPQARGDALREWVPLSGIIAQGGTPVIDYLYKR
jgi:hypothetical protein